MRIPRRRFLQLVATAAALPAAPRIARSIETYPTRPVTLLVGYAAGGPADTVARLMAQWLSERLGQQVVVDNRVGAGSNIATEAVVRSPPDGYTLLFLTVSNAVNVSLFDKLDFDVSRDLVPIAGIMRLPAIMEVTLSFPAKTFPEFMAHARANPGKINMSSAGPGSAPYLYIELLKFMTGVDLMQVHYRGSGPALPDLIAGQVQATFDPVASSIPHIRAGKLRALAVTSATRLEALPDIPTVGEFVPGYEASSWYGIGAPKNTPAEIVQRLNAEINAALSDAKMKVRFAELGGTVLPGSPADLGKLLTEETEKWGKVIRAANLKVK
jgi:tripartite-type tricarboxylate transporter receptor subunit TctC